MPNHYHLFIATPEASLSTGIQWLNGTYAQRFNRRHERVGHLFQGRFGAFLVDSEAYLLAVVRYIAWNPVKARLCQSPEEWPWSSHAAALALAPSIGAFAWDRILGEFGPDPEIGMEKYADFIANVEAGERPLGTFSNPMVIGDDAFTKVMSERAACTTTEVIREERRSTSLQAIVDREGDRNAAIRAAHASGTYSLAQLGRHFGLHYSTVSKICRTPENATELETAQFLVFD